MRILQILEGAYLGGCELYALKVASHAQASGAQVKVLLSEDGHRTVRPAYEAAGVSCASYPSLVGAAFKRRWAQMKRMASVYASIQRFKPDVIQVVASYQTQVPELVQACLRSGLPTQVVFQLVDPALGLPARHRAQFEKFRAPHLQLSFVSNSSQNAFLEVLGTQDLNVQVIENGVAVHELPSPAQRLASRQRLAAELKLPLERRWWLTVANLYTRKGYHSLIHAFAAMRERDDAFHGLWVGGGHGDLEEIRTEVKRYGLEDCVTFCGAHADVTPFYEAAEAFVFPSLLEGFSFALLEAMSYQLPVIASDCIGNRDTIQDGVNGRLIRAGNSIQLWKSLVALGEEPEKFRDFGKKARETAEVFSESRMLEKTLASLQSLAAANRR